MKMDMGWFRDRLADRGMEQQDLAKALDLDPAAISHMLRGRRRMQVSEATIIAKELGAPLSEVIARAGIDVPKAAKETVPLVGLVNAAGEVSMLRARDIRRVPIPPEVLAETVALRFQGEGEMDGWCFYYAPAKNVPREAIGRLCVIMAGDRGMVRVLKHGYKPLRYNLLPWGNLADSRGAIENARVTAAAPVIWVKCG